MAMMMNTPKAACRAPDEAPQERMRQRGEQFEMDPEKLYVSKSTPEPGPILKRMHAQSPGPSVSHQQRTSHITIVVAEKE
jgi:large subunit ribosomal protein L22